MWDEAIQVIIDHQPSHNIIEYQQAEPASHYYRLTMTDFVKAVSKCYNIVHHHELPNVIDFNVGNRQVEWFVSKLASTNGQGRPEGAIKGN